MERKNLRACVRAASLVGHGDLPDDEVAALGFGGRHLLALCGLGQTVQLAAFVP